MARRRMSMCSPQHNITCTVGVLNPLNLRILVKSSVIVHSSSIRYQMQLTSEDMSSEGAEKDQLLERIRRESAFITGVLNSLQSVHQYAGDDDLSEGEEVDDEVDGDNVPVVESYSRAQTVEELQERLKNLQAKRTSKVPIKDRMLKKGCQDRLKKKKKLLLRKEQKKEKMNLVKQQLLLKSKSESTEKKPKPVFNSEGKMVFSKFDFSVSGGSKDSKVQKGPKDPKKILEKIKSKEERLAKIAETGNIDKVIEIKQKDAWQKALQKSEGLKVRDDPELLKKSIKKKEVQKKRSAEQWAAREKAVKKQMEERQKIRQSNIDAKKEVKRKRKYQQLVKRGKLIPGF